MAYFEKAFQKARPMGRYLDILILAVPRSACVIHMAIGDAILDPVLDMEEAGEAEMSEKRNRDMKQST